MENFRTLKKGGHCSTKKGGNSKLIHDVLYVPGLDNWYKRVIKSVLMKINVWFWIKKNNQIVAKVKMITNKLGIFSCTNLGIFESPRANLSTYKSRRRTSDWILLGFWWKCPWIPRILRFWVFRKFAGSLLRNIFEREIFC